MSSTRNINDKFLEYKECGCFSGKIPLSKVPEVSDRHMAAGTLNCYIGIAPILFGLLICNPCCIPLLCFITPSINLAMGTLSCIEAKRVERLGLNAALNLLERSSHAPEHQTMDSAPNQTEYKPAI